MFKLIFVCLFILNDFIAHAETIVLGCVDCYSSFSLAPAAARRLAPNTNIKWILIQTHEYSSGEDQYLATFPADSERIVMDAQTPGVNPLPNARTPDEVAQVLKLRGVKYVFGGMDKGAYASPLLNERLGFPDNPLSSRDDRRKKDVMSNASGRFGIPTHDLTNVDEAVTWLGQFPQRGVIAKLNAGVLGSKLKSLSKDDPAELRRQLQALIDDKDSTSNSFNERDKFVVQPKIQGRQFFANTYTYNGVTTLTSVAEYLNIEWNGTVLYCLVEFLDLDSKEANALREVVQSVNPKLGVRHGPAHPEIILDEITGEWKLIEMNARIVGVGIPSLEKEIYGLSHLDLHLLSVLDPKRLEQEIANFPVKRRRSAVMFLPPSPAYGAINPTALRQIRGLKSYFIPASHYEVKPGKKVLESTDQVPRAGIYYFIGDPQTVRSDVKLTIGLFDKGKLIDFSMDPALPANGCQGAMAGVKKGQLTNLIHNAKNKLRWN